MGYSANPFEVTLTKNFCMDKHEFTNHEKDELMVQYPELENSLSWPNSASANTYDMNFDGPSQPLIMVNWYQAKAICEKQGKSLPTEAQWEYAARVGNADCFYGTKDCLEPNERNACWSGRANNQKFKTCEVAKYDANKFGLYDMSGNVWEWTNDWHDEYSFTAQTDPVGPSSGKNKVTRGGAWDIDNPVYLQIFTRIGAANIDYSDDSLGFRCVKNPND